MEYFNNSFVDRHNTKWEIRLTTRIALRFCGSHNLQVEQLLPSTLNDDQLFDLAWDCVQHHQDAKKFHNDDKIEPIEGWLERACVGTDLMKCKEAVQHALVNFTLQRLPQKHAIVMHKAFVLAREKETLAQDGANERLSKSLSEQESNPTTTTPSDS